MMPDHHSSLVRKIVRSFCKVERPTGREPFRVHGPYDRTSVLHSPAVDGPGCYVIYSADGTLRYVGMSQGAVGFRARSHFAAKTQAHPFWKDAPACFIDLVETHQTWEPPSLEAYLILHTVGLNSDAVGQAEPPT